MIGSVSHVLRLPAVRFFLLLAAGILLSDAYEFDGSVVFITACVVVAIAVVLHVLSYRWKKGRAYAQLLTVLCVFLIGVHLGQRSRESVDTALLPFADTKNSVQLRGVIEDQPVEKRNRSSFFLSVFECRTDSTISRLNARTLVYYSVSAYEPNDILAPVHRGDTITVTGVLRTPQHARNPNGFDFRNYLRRQGVTTYFSAAGGAKVHVAGPVQRNIIENLLAYTRDYIREGISQLFSGDNADIMNGLLLGERGRIRDEINDTFRDAGVIHILAVSGLHVGILLAMVWIPLGRLRYATRSIVALAVLWLFAWLTGMAPPVVRAVVMATVVLLGTSFQRITQPLNSLAAAGAIILLLNPASLFLPSFQLSFSAVAALLLFIEPLNAFIRRKLQKISAQPVLSSLLSILVMTTIAQIGTLPCTLVYFGQFSLVSFVANLVVIPAIFVVVSLGLTSVLLHGLWSGLATVFAASSALSLSAIVESSAYLAGLPFAVIHIAKPPLWLPVVYVALLFVLFGINSRTKQKLVTALVVSAAAFILAWDFHTEDNTSRLRITFLDVGQGDATLVEFPNGTNMLLDAGPMSRDYDTGARTILPYLQSRGITTIDALVLTHPDNDHIGGAGALLNALDVHAIYYACQWKREGLQFYVDSLMNIEGATVNDIRAGEQIALDPQVKVFVLSPSPDASFFASNNTSIVLKIVYGNTSFLLTGDAEREAESAMVHRYGNFLQSDVLKVGHHGSLTSTIPAFILKVKPTYAVISCGRLNRFNHPRQEILTRLSIVGADILRTDLKGAITLESDGETVSNIAWR